MMRRNVMVAAFAFGLIASTSLAAVAADWSAIAVDFRDDMSRTAWGIGRGESMAEAGTAAMAFCAKSGGGNCRTVVSYTNCGAFAAGKSSVGYGMADSQKMAETNALAGCGASSCKIVVSDCSRPATTQ